MKQFFLCSILFLVISYTQGQTKDYHELLQKHVDNNGNVDYFNLKTDSPILVKYLDFLKETSPTKDWSDNKTKAFWINAYNAYTLKLIIENYPLKSILNVKKNGKDAWNIPFAKVAGKSYTLNHIEHEILRKDFNDPRIHVGVNCASESCPQLGNFAFTEQNIEHELERLMGIFVNDVSRNKISPKKMQLSKIFEWFTADFTKEGTLIEFLNRYATTKISKKAKIRYLAYDWNLNGK